MPLDVTSLRTKST